MRNELLVMYAEFYDRQIPKCNNMFDYITCSLVDHVFVNTYVDVYQPDVINGIIEELKLTNDNPH
jgi:hypothetical protein